MLPDCPRVLSLFPERAGGTRVLSLHSPLLPLKVRVTYSTGRVSSAFVSEPEARPLLCWRAVRPDTRGDVCLPLCVFLGWEERARVRRASCPRGRLWNSREPGAPLALVCALLVVFATPGGPAAGGPAHGALKGQDRPRHRVRKGRVRSRRRRCEVTSMEGGVRDTR